MIGEQVWMAENLNCYVAGSKCYNNDSANCATYGRLYDWATAMGIDEKYNRELWNGSDAKHQGICPSGWHIPSNEDWNILITTAINATGGSSFTIGTKLKAENGWNLHDDIPFGTDDFGFSALPGGDGGPDGKFANVGVAGSWWSTIEYDSNLAYFWNLIYFRESGSLGYYDGYGKRRLLSVRCLKD